MTLIVSLLVLVSLVSHDPTEEPTIGPDVELHNWMGYAGVFISYYLMKMFIGWGALILPLLGIGWGVYTLLDKTYKPLVRFTAYTASVFILLSIFTAMVMLHLENGLALAYRHTGAFSVGTTRLLEDFLGVWGAFLIVVGLLVVTIQGWLGFSWKLFFEQIRQSFAEWRRSREQKAARKSKADSAKEKSEPVKTEVPSIAEEDAEIDAEVPPPITAIDPKKTEQQQTVPEETESVEGVDSEADEDERDDIAIEEAVVEEEVDYDKTKPKAPRREYKLPTVDLLETPIEVDQSMSREELLHNADLLVQALGSFGVEGKVTHIAPGPVITRYEIEPGPGIRVAKIASLSDDIARVMKARRVRIIAPIPGKNSVGVELPNPKPEIVYLKSVINSEKFTDADGLLTIALGKTTSGELFVADLAKMPHLLIAGATGSGKSVCINVIITSLLYRARPDQVKFIMIDPKKLELSIYRQLVGYHLITGEGMDEHVLTKPKNAVQALRAAELEMEKRYEILSEATVRNIEQYNERAAKSDDMESLPYIVVVIDELADLMITAAKEVEEPITRLAQMARAVGIHLIIATQRPSVDVITGVIKANFPTRIAFQVAQKNDSRTILDQNGAEKLLGRGDMLFQYAGAAVPTRLHCALVTLEEIESILDHISNEPKPEEEFLPEVRESGGDGSGVLGDEVGDRDDLFDEAYRLVVTHQQGSVSLLQRRLKIGYARAGRLIDQLELAGVVGPNTGSKAREVLVGPEILEKPSFEDDDDE
ncbi:MAG: DNA translocase FtsK [Candidatus Marinimicrobia bacterium]|nr:DNA translocase FtsK [Candidatus Neomarinimicrobiota bacterium]MCF7840531.1 DNA translocase FtsK [Candidatus Neomarinimicrobiota bacterium]